MVQEIYLKSMSYSWFPILMLSYTEYKLLFTLLNSGQNGRRLIIAFGLVGMYNEGRTSGKECGFGVKELEMM